MPHVLPQAALVQRADLLQQNHTVPCKAAVSRTDADVGGQSVRVRAQLAEASRLLPGQQFDVTLQLPAPVGALSIPVTALLQDGEQHVVFVQDGAAWRRVQVRQLGGDARIAIVQADELKAGMLVAVTGGNVLKTLLAVV